MGKGSWEEVTWPIHLSKWWEYNSPLLSRPCIHPIHLSWGTRKEILSYGKTWMNTLANLIEWLCKLSWSTEGQSLPLTLLSSLSLTSMLLSPCPSKNGGPEWRGHPRAPGQTARLLQGQRDSGGYFIHSLCLGSVLFQWNKSSGNRGESPGTEDHPTNSWYRLHMVGVS